MRPSHTLILDGIWGRPRRWRLLGSRIERAGVGTTQIVYYDMTGRSTFQSLGEHLLKVIDDVGDPSQINIVAHSMGGLVVRAAHLLRPTLRFRRAVLSCSPLHGSLPAWLLPLAGVKQMRPGSEFLKRLVEVESQWTTPTLTVWCPGDLIILPASSSRWRAAQQEITCWVPAHIWPSWSGSIHRKMIQFLKHDVTVSAGTPPTPRSAAAAGSESNT
jgi:triacylglycerol lipase